MLFSGAYLVAPFEHRINGQGSSPICRVGYRRLLVVLDVDLRIFPAEADKLSEEVLHLNFPVCKLFFHSAVWVICAITALAFSASVTSA